jgi:hypothetical protein
MAVYQEAQNSLYRKSTSESSRWNKYYFWRRDPRTKMKGRAIYLLLLLGFLSVALAGECLTGDEANAIVSRWASLAIKIDVKVVNEAVTDDFQFF